MGTTLLIPLLIAACSSDSDEGATETGAAAAATDELATATEGYALKQTFDMDIELTSPVFNRIRRIPLKYSCVKTKKYNARLGKTFHGENQSPPLEWSGVPDGAKSIALIVDSTQAPGKPWLHWVLWGIPSDATSLPEGVANGPEAHSVGLSAGQGVNDNKETGYSGPCPPPADKVSQNWWSNPDSTGKVVFEYFFNLYALDTELDLGPNTTKDELLQAIDGHILSGAHRKGEIAAQVLLEGSG